MSGAPEAVAASRRRAEAIEREFRDGATMEELAAKYAISRQRVHQILRRRGVRGEDGGLAVRRRRELAVWEGK